MGLVKVHNLNDFDYSEKYNGQMIVIPAGEYIKMEYFEAEQFLAKKPPIWQDKSGGLDPRCLKHLKIDEDDKKLLYEEMHDNPSSESEKAYVCHACFKEFRTQKGLLKHIKNKHIHLMADKDAKDELLDDEDI